MRLRILVASVLALLGLTAASGQVVWNGTFAFDGSNSLSDGFNWIGGVAPTGSGTEDFIFGDIVPPSAAANDTRQAIDLLIATSVNNIGFTGGANRPLYDFSGTGATFTINGNVSVGTGQAVMLRNSINVALGTGAHTITVDGDRLDVSSVISGLGASIIKDGSSYLILSGANTFTGGVTVNAGTLVIGRSSTGNVSTGPVGTGLLTLNNGTTLSPSFPLLTLANNISVNGAVTFGDYSMPSRTLALSGTISGTGSIENTTGTLRLSGANTFSGGLTMDAGTLELFGSTDPGFTSGPVGTGDLTLWTGTTLLPGTSTSSVTLANRIILEENGDDNYIYVDSGETALSLTLTGTISGDYAGIDWYTPGTLTLTNAGSTFGYGIIMEEGTLLIGASSTAHYDLEFQEYVVDQGPVGTDWLDMFDGTALGVVSGTQTLHNSVYLDTDGGIVTVDTSNGNLILLGDIFGDALLDKVGSGTLTLGGRGYFYGGVRINTGTLLLASSSNNFDGISGPVGSDPLTMMDGTTLGVSPLMVGPVSLDNPVQLDPNSATNVTIDTTNGDLSLLGLISGAAGLTKTGPNTLTFSGFDTIYDSQADDFIDTYNYYTGPTSILGGILSTSTLANGGLSSDIGASGSSAANLVLNGGALQYTGASVATNRLFTVGTSGGGVRLTSASTLILSNTGAISLTGTNAARTLKFTVDNSAGQIALNPVLADNGTGRTSLIKDGAGTLSLQGANTYTGSTWIKDGTLKVNATSLSSLTALIIDAGANLSSHDVPVSIGSLAGGGNVLMAGPSGGPVALTIGADNTSTTFSGTIQEQDNPNSISLVKTGTGTLTLTGANVYGGGTTVSGGMLVAGNNAAFGSGSVTLNGGGISVASGVTLTNSLVFAGAPTILGGNGTFGTAITADSHVILSPGNSPGTLTFSAGLTLASGAAISFQIQDAAGAAGVGYDLISVTGGSLNLTAGPGTILFNVSTLNSSGNPGNAQNFDSSSSYSWTFATSPNSVITGFNPNQFYLVLGFNNSIAGGSFSFAQSLDQHSLLLNFTPVPEPSTWLLLGSGLGALALRLRRRR